MVEFLISPCNLLLKSGALPEDWEEVRVMPIFNIGPGGNGKTTGQLA